MLRSRRGKIHRQHHPRALGPGVSPLHFLPLLDHVSITGHSPADSRKLLGTRSEPWGGLGTYLPPRKALWRPSLSSSDFPLYPRNRPASFVARSRRTIVPACGSRRAVGPRRGSIDHSTRFRSYRPSPWFPPTSHLLQLPSPWAAKPIASMSTTWPGSISLSPTLECSTAPG